jgi:hypothetical protein
MTSTTRALRAHLETAAEARRRGDLALADAAEVAALVALRALLAAPAAPSGQEGCGNG